MNRISLAALSLIGIAGCAMAANDRPPRLSERQARELAEALKDKVPGKPVACVSRVLGGTHGLHAVSDSILIYKVNRDLVYRNDLNGSCNGISRGNTMVLKPTVDQYCRGDIVRSVDLSTRMQVGSCGLGSFVPYRTPGK
ncbi:MAG TPA: hypothetical protein VL918_01975 [Sphingobium sp.]|nr:hypothetical protein [Sphingobium sp.]